MNEPKDFRTPFIPAWLDDFGFTPVEFRIVCRIHRRQGDGSACWQSYPTMAGELGMHRDTLTAAVRRLITGGVLTRKARPGTTSLLRLTPPETWTKPGPQIPLTLKTSRRNADRHPEESKGCHPEESKGYEGSPLKVPPKGSPKKGVRPSVDEIISQVGFPHKGIGPEKLWREWIEFRLSIKAPDHRKLFVKQKELLESKTVEVFTAAVTKSLLNQYTGLFPDERNAGRPISKTNPAHSGPDGWANYGKDQK